MKQETYIVVSKNEIVKTDVEKPYYDHYFYANKLEGYKVALKKYQEHSRSLPRIPIQGKHNWKVWQEVKEGKDFYLMDTDKWYWCKCEKCGWEGSSQLCKGGGPIADTGDYDDALCPECMSNDLDGETDNGPGDYTGIVAIPIEQTKSDCNHDGLVDTGVGYYHCPMCDQGWTYQEWSSKQTKSEQGEKVHCNQCGGNLASVRGRYPGDPKRIICPTCVIEELESLKQNNSAVKLTNDNPQTK